MRWSEAGSVPTIRLQLPNCPPLVVLTQASKGLIGRARASSQPASLLRMFGGDHSRPRLVNLIWGRCQLAVNRRIFRSRTSSLNLYARIRKELHPSHGSIAVFLVHWDKR